MNKILTVINTILIVTIGLVVLIGGQSAPEVGSGTRYPNGISADSTAPSAGEVRGTTLTVTGASSLSGALTGTSGSFSSTLGVTGTSTLATTTITDLTVSGAAALQSTLAVTGASTIAALTASGTSTLATTTATLFSVSGAGTFSSTLGVTGAVTLSSTLGVSGAATFSNAVNVDNTASSTVQVGSTADGIGTGCLVLGDSGGATSTPVYITATGATITATTTKPAICR